MGLAESLAQQWRSHLQTEFPHLSSSTQESIVQWLLGEDSQQLNDLTQTNKKCWKRGYIFAIAFCSNGT
jgi:hypothetical protein